MPEITIHVSEPLAEYLTAEAKRRGVADPSAAAHVLLEEAAEAHFDEFIGRAIDEGLASGEPVEWDVAGIKGEILEQERKESVVRRAPDDER